MCSAARHSFPTHRVSRQSSTSAWVPAWPRTGRWPEDGTAWCGQSRRLWSAPPGSACTGTNRCPARWHTCTAWRWRHSAWGGQERRGRGEKLITLHYTQKGTITTFRDVILWKRCKHKVNSSPWAFFHVLYLVALVFDGLSFLFWDKHTLVSWSIISLLMCDTDRTQK